MKRTVKKIFKYGLLLVTSLLLVLLVMFFAGWREQNLDRQYKSELIGQLYSFREALNFDQFLTLSFTEDGWKHPHYVRVKNQLDAYHEYYPDEHVYCLVPSDSGFIYGITNADDANVLTGRLYDDVGLIANRMLSNQKPDAFGPYLKNGHEVMSALLPLNDPETGDIVALLGIDVPDTEYHETKRQLRWFSIIIALIAVIIMLGSMAFIYWRNRQGLHTRTQFRHAETMLTILLGILLTLLGVMVSNDLYVNEKRSEFDLQSSQMSRLVSDGLQRLRENVRITGVYFENSDEVFEGEFDNFTRELLKNSSLKSLAYAELVGQNATRFASDYDSSGELFTFQGETFIIKYIAFSDFVDTTAWLFNKVNVREQDLLKALDARLTYASDPFESLSKHNHQRFNIYYPVFDPKGSNSNSALKGFVLAAVDVQMSLDLALNSLKWEGENASVGIIDLMPDATPAVLASFPPHHATIRQDEHFHDHLSSFLFSGNIPVFIFGRTYAIVSHTSHEFESSLNYMRSWLIALAGLVITVLIGWIVRGTMNMRIKLESLVNNRTRELTERIKEISALKKVNETIHDSSNEVEVMSEIPLILLESLQQPEKSNIEIEYQQHHYHAKYMFMNNPVVYVKNIGVGSRSYGVIRALTEVPGGLLQEELDVIDQSALLLGRWIEKRLASQELRKSQEMFSMLIENAFDAVYLMEDNRYTYVNHSYERLTGYSREELTDESFDYLDLLTDEGKEMVKERVRRRECGEEVPPQYTLKIKSKSGSVRDVELSTVAIPVENRQIILGIMHDLTERIQAENALKNSEEELVQQNEELEVMNEELAESNRQVRLLNLDLLQAKEKAEASDKLKTAFLNNISHEVRTPLNGILGGVSLITEMDPDDEKRPEIAEMIDLSAQRLLRTITQYMDISMLSSDSMPVILQSIDIHEALRPVYEWCETACTAKGLRFSISRETDDKLPSRMQTDPSLIGKVMNHLLDNAVKFTHEGQVSIGFECGQEQLRLIVSDTGIGINPSIRDRIFEIFMQEDQSNIRKFDGSGLGLAISQKIALLLGGNLTYEPNKGRGSRFTFTVPVARHELSAQDSTLTVENNRLPEQPLVLIAEDEDSNFAVLELLMKRKFNARISRAMNGQQAVEYCQLNPDVQLIIMDIKMPVMDGFEATRLIKSIRPKLPVLGLTAYGLSGDERRVREAGCDAYMAKPYKSAELILIINDLLTKRNEKLSDMNSGF